MQPNDAGETAKNLALSALDQGRDIGAASGGFGANGYDGLIDSPVDPKRAFVHDLGKTLWVFANAPCAICECIALH